jgi:diguanylate cyclase (GGDEF)-like protein
MMPDGAIGRDEVLPASNELVECLRERIRLLEAVVDNFPGGISLFDNDLRMVLCNEQQKQLLEYPDSLFAGGYPTLEQIFRFNAQRGEYGLGDVEEHVRLRMALAAEQRAHVVERTRPNGTVLEVRGVPLSGGGFVTTYLDVTEQRRAQAMVAHMAHHDALTNLPNRVLFRDRLCQAIARARRGELMALHYLDLDRFKPVNDGFGHAVGDALLKAVADRLRAAARDTDTVARLGGDEFVVIQVGIKDASEAAVLARRLTNVVATPYIIDGRTVDVGASIGIALAPRDAADPDELLKKADGALYSCKTGGRGSFAFYRPADPASDRCRDGGGAVPVTVAAA